MHAPLASRRSPLPTASLRDTLGVAAGVFLPNVAKGVIRRRPRMVRVAEWLDLDARAVRRMRRLRERYGDGPLMLRIPGRAQAVVLAPEHVRRVLDATPEPFAAASSEKRAALAHFQPEGVLVSHGAERAERRRYNEAVLESGCPRHRMAARFEAVVREEAAAILDEARRTGTLGFHAFSERWFRVVRRVVLGEGAADDRELTDALDRLRDDANWAFLKPRRRGLRKRFYARLKAHIARAEPGSLGAMMAATPASADTAPVGQVPQWLFAFDAAGMATFRALAVLTTHPDIAERARADAAPEREYLRACVLESVRLWPTTPMVLRQSTLATAWDGGVMPAGAGVLIFVPYFHRDESRLPFAHAFTPELWLGDRPATEWPLIPFSGGPAACPGEKLVLLLTSAMLAALLEARPRLASRPRLGPDRPLPGTLDNFALRFAFDG